MGQVRKNLKTLLENGRRFRGSGNSKYLLAVLVLSFRRLC